MADIQVPYFYARPKGPSAGKPGIVVIMEGNGMSQQLLRVCERYAAEGYTTIAPELFFHFGGSDVERSMAEGHLTQLTPEQGLADIAECIKVLRDAGVSSVGITGYCMGGFYSYAATTNGLDVQAAVGFYGRIGDVLGTPACPQLHFFGGNDKFISRDEMEAVKAHHPDETTICEGADHGFMRDGSPSYHPEHGPAAWERTLAFFREHLH